jgi:hypothetical protein
VKCLWLHSEIKCTNNAFIANISAVMLILYSAANGCYVCGNYKGYIVVVTCFLLPNHVTGWFVALGKVSLLAVVNGRAWHAIWRRSSHDAFTHYWIRTGDLEGSETFEDYCPLRCDIVLSARYLPTFRTNMLPQLFCLEDEGSRLLRNVDIPVYTKSRPRRSNLYSHRGARHESYNEISVFCNTFELILWGQYDNRDVMFLDGSTTNSVTI